MIGVLYDIHGNAVALDAVLADAAARGVTEYLLGGDLAAFGPQPHTVLDRLDGLPVVASIRGNTERWLADEADFGGDESQPMLAAVRLTRLVVGNRRADALFALPEHAEHAGATFWHASPVSDLRSFGRAPGDADDELLGGFAGARLVFGHTHVQFRRTRPDGIELVNPGSVGIPLDGDQRAAYATLAPDGQLELHRVAYDWEAVRDEVLLIAEDRPWGAIIAGRLERAAV